MLPTILLMGLNHTTAPVQIREHAFPFTCEREHVQDRIRTAFDPALFSEYLILATCNRTEIYAVTTDARRALAVLGNIFAFDSSFAPAQDLTYRAADRDAIQHLFAVAAGIDSLVLGEFEILGQVRRAYREAAAHQTVGPLLNQLFQAAMHAGKRVRAETEIGRGAQSVAYAAVALAREKIGALHGRRALVIGAGEMGRRAAENLAEDGDCAVTIATRTYEHALELAQRIGAQAAPLQEIARVLSDSDIVLVATRAPHLILSRDTIAGAMQARPHRPLCLIDIAVPRNIDPGAADIPNVRLYNIDDLHQVVERTRTARLQAVREAHAILHEETEEFWQWYLARRAAPLIGELYARAERIRRAELEKTLRRLDHLDLSARERNIINALSAGLVSKLLAGPTANLKAHLQTGNGQLYLEAMRDLFDLNSQTGDETK